MKKIFEWLREEIEKNSIDISNAKIISTHNARILVNVAEKAYEDNYCEWQHKRRGVNTMCECTKLFVNYEFALGFKHCPYCGKLIKISEVE